MTTLLCRFMPDSLSKQISLTLLASIGLLFFVNMGVVYFIQNHFLGMLEKERSVNIVSMYVLLSGIETTQRDKVFARITRMQENTSKHALTFHLIQDAPSWTAFETRQTKQAISTLREMLIENNITPLPEVHVRLFSEGDNFQIDGWARQVSGNAPVCDNPLLQLGVRLDANNWLNITQPLYQSAGWLLWVQRLIFLVEFAIFGVLVLFLLRRLIKPFQQLTQAAEQVGKQPEVASPVPETGCKEIREAAQSFNRMQVRIQNNLAERTAFCGYFYA